MPYVIKRLALDHAGSQSKDPVLDMIRRMNPLIPTSCRLRNVECGTWLLTVGTRRAGPPAAGEAVGRGWRGSVRGAECADVNQVAIEIRVVNPGFDDGPEPAGSRVIHSEPGRPMLATS